MGFIEKIRDYALSKGYYSIEETEYETEDVEETEVGEHEDKKRGDKPALEDSRRFSAIYASKRDSGPAPAKVFSFPVSNAQQTVVITYPESIDESGVICDYIRNDNTVVVNLDGIRHETAQRIVDFLSGVVHSLEGDIQYISNKIFIVAPRNVEITGRIKEEIRSGGILATLKTSYR